MPRAEAGPAWAVQGKAEQGQLPAAAAAQPGSQRLAGIAPHAVEQMLGPDPRIATAGLTAVRSGMLAAGCGGGGVGLLVALEARVGAGLVGGTYSGRAVRAHRVPPGLLGPAWLWYHMG